MGQDTTRHMSLKELSGHPNPLTGGHRLCAGCAEPVIVRQVIGAASPHPVAVVCATGCLEVATTIYPFNAWTVPWLHNAFENAAATASGMEAAYRILREKKRMPDKEVRIAVFGGDGGTYDIGLQSLSGAFERGHRFVYVCLNNEGYMNTGIQRSSATPLGASTTTTPVGGTGYGKIQWRKDLTGIIAAHRIPYVAQSAPSVVKLYDLSEKAAKAFATEGPAFLNVLSSCNRGWRHETSETFEITQLALDTCYWPMFEIVHGRWKLNYRPKEKKPITAWLERQGRFRHLLGNEQVLKNIQDRVDQEWEELLMRCGETR